MQKTTDMCGRYLNVVTFSGKVNFSNWTRALSILGTFFTFDDFEVSKGSSANESDIDSTDFLDFFGDFVWNFGGDNGSSRG